VKSNRRQAVLGIVEVVDSDTDLSEVVGTLGSPSGFACSLNSRQKKRDQQTNNRYHHQKLNKSKTKKRKMFFEREITRFIFKINLTLIAYPPPPCLF
jgi:hypothetical protein